MDCFQNLISFFVWQHLSIGQSVGVGAGVGVVVVVVRSSQVYGNRRPMTSVEECEKPRAGKLQIGSMKRALISAAGCY